jgi:hypothetical protein
MKGDRRRLMEERMTHALPARHWPLWRRALPVLLIPLGLAYCQLFELCFGTGTWELWGDLAWAGLTLGPWVLAAILFEHGMRPDDTRKQLVARAAMLCGVAYLASAIAALAIGGDNVRAFYSRVPMIAAGLLIAVLYPILPRAAEAAAPAEDGDPPITPTDIVFASAAGNYVELHYGGRSTVWRQTMQNAERILAPAGFVRIHRSFLVPRHEIAKVSSGRKGPVAVALRDGKKLPVSHSYAGNLRLQ